eukprot:355136-Chlamydomonas_euryale.AAC.10
MANGYRLLLIEGLAFCRQSYVHEQTGQASPSWCGCGQCLTRDGHHMAACSMHIHKCTALLEHEQS